MNESRCYLRKKWDLGLQVMVIILSLGQETSAVLGAETEAAGQLHGGNKYIWCFSKFMVFFHHNVIGREN